MMLVVALIAGVYLACFLWFRSLCKSALRFHHFPMHQGRVSNLVPFERGLEIRSRSQNA
ncbi:MAG: hypothetical protein IRZ03_09185 [Acidobacterium ailaaui]|jgi:hypothetical protein|nr:hypothetical protein [Pseudacidobacterium ailaaui]MCL6463475.1 hypothetical protein [Pseudacidobacterium ailaaui]